MLQKNSIVGIFFDNPTSRFQLRELARLSGLSTTGVRSQLDCLLSEGIIKKETEKYYQFYKANSEAKEYKLAKKFNTIKKIIASNLLEFLDQKLANPEAIILFGSAARGEDTEKSDLDIFVLAEEKDINLDKFEKKLKRPIRLLIIDRRKFKDAKKKSADLVNNILNGYILKGYIEVI